MAVAGSPRHPLVKNPANLAMPTIGSSICIFGLCIDTRKKCFVYFLRDWVRDAQAATIVPDGGKCEIVEAGAPTGDVVQLMQRR